MVWQSTPIHAVETVVKLTWLQVTFTRLSPKPWLTVVAIIELWDEGEVTGDLPIIGDLELLLLQLTELHILKLKLQSKEKTSHVSGTQTLQWQPMTEKRPRNAELLAEDLPRSQDKMSLLIQFLIIR